MKYLFFLTLVFLPLGDASAYVPVIVDQTSLHDIETIADPTLSQAFYGTLDAFPHTYEIRAKEPFTLHVEVLIPDIETATENVSGIIIKETGKQGRVVEVDRLLGSDATWESFYEPWGGDSYRRGETYTDSVEAGVYRIEVSTPDNKSPYVLIVGTEERFGELGYFETIGRIMEVKRFFGEPSLMVIVSPLVYVPLLILCILIAFFIYRRKVPHTSV